jgi:hypothetical protein
MNSEEQRRLNARRERGLPVPTHGRKKFPWAYVGRNHPDYGLTVDEHVKAKSERPSAAERNRAELEAEASRGRTGK